MSRLVIAGPTPAVQENFCAVCVADWKAELIRSHGIDQEWVDKTVAQTTPAVVTLHQKRGHIMPPLHEAVTVIPVQLMGWAPVPVCWTHAAASRINPEPPEPAGFRKPPGLITGMS